VISQSWNYDLELGKSVQRVLVTGGAGFIGSNLVRMMVESGRYHVVVLDALTYAGNLANLADVLAGELCDFEHGNICDAAFVRSVLQRHSPTSILHLAAESHVDRSIASAAPFVETNVKGTLVLLEAVRAYPQMRFVHVSTDEVYGTLGPDDAPFTETTPLDPTSPYAASKAASDLLVQSFIRTHGVDAVITRCSNNYGPFQFPEKFIPLMTLNALEGRPLPIYGDGLQVRDWLHVDDHCRGILAALERGTTGAVYNFGGYGERTNEEMVSAILAQTGASADLKTYVTDRKAHDRRYAINADKARHELGWVAERELEEGLRSTIAWYMQNRAWSDNVRTGAYRTYYETHYNTTL
jgi:dTDP-glucose 4,6-dehydratase